mgnify:CR=1 FL=1
MVKIILGILDKDHGFTNSEILIEHVEDRKGHDFRYSVDCSKIHKELNWKQKETFKTGIQKTIQWYLENESWWRKIQKETYHQQRLGTKKS